jgi:hypothetical protein
VPGEADRRPYREELQGLEVEAGDVGAVEPEQAGGVTPSLCWTVRVQPKTDP